MEAALGQVGASPELERLFQVRYQHVRGAHYRNPGLTCYAQMAFEGPWPEARASLLEQWTEVERLRDDGSLTEEAARKAANVIARGLEVRIRHEALRGDREEAEKGRAELVEEIEAGGPTARQSAVRAAEHVVEFSADVPGMLTGSKDGPADEWNGVRCYSVAPTLQNEPPKPPGTE